MRLNYLPKTIPLSSLLLVAFLAGGCGDTTQPPTAISLDQIPAELGKTFASAKEETKELSGLAVTAVQSKEYPKTAIALDALTRHPNLSNIQSRTIAGAAITIN